MSARKDPQAPRPKSTRFDDLPLGPIVPFDPSWDAGPRVPRSELPIVPMADDGDDSKPSIYGAVFNPSDAAAGPAATSRRRQPGRRRRDARGHRIMPPTPATPTLCPRPPHHAANPGDPDTLPVATASCRQPG